MTDFLPLPFWSLTDHFWRIYRFQLTFEMRVRTLTCHPDKGRWPLALGKKHGSEYPISTGNRSAEVSERTREQKFLWISIPATQDTIRVSNR